MYAVVWLLVAIGVNSHTEEEIQEANQRNRAVSSSAIQRAMTDANSGEIFIYDVSMVTRCYMLYIQVTMRVLWIL